MVSGPGTEQLTQADLDAMAQKIAENGGVLIDELFDCIGRGAHDLADAIRSDDQARGPAAASAFLNALELLPASLREDIAVAVTERPGLAENPHLERLAW